MVRRLTWQKARKTQRWWRVPGHVSLSALASPSPPSGTTTPGAATRDMSAAQARLLSGRRSAGPGARPSSEAISTTALRPRWMPSTKTTLRGASTFGGMGQTSQGLAALRLRVLPPPGMSAWRPRPSSHPRKAPRSFAAFSILWVVLAPQEVHPHRVLPALVLPPLSSSPRRGGMREPSSPDLP